MKRLIVLLLLAAPRPLPAQASTSPSKVGSPAPEPSGNHGLRAAHVALIVSGAVLVSSFYDDAVQQELQEWRNGASNSIARVGNSFGSGAYVYPALIATWVAGLATGNDRVRDIGGHTLTAATAAGLVVTGLKWTVGRERPSSGADADHFHSFHALDSSFPSGHTAVAFSVASSLGAEIPGHWDDVGLYGLATLTGFARMNDNKHWLSDVVGGAAVGILAGRWATRSHREHVVVGPGSLGVGFSF